METLPFTPIGSHIPVSGGLATGGLPYAAKVEAEAVQLFLSNPRGWSRSPGAEEEDARFRDRTDLAVFVHAPYLVNPASPRPGVAEKSRASIAHALRRGGEIGARGVVVHTGSTVQGSRSEGLARVREMLLPLLDSAEENGPDLLLEPMAGQGSTLCSALPELVPYLDAVEWHPRARVCLDTAHLFAAGHDISTRAGMRAVLDTFAASAGAERLGLVHANDSASTLGSAKDRHANLGAGHIGAGPFAALFEHPACAGVPVVVETPGPAAPHAEDVAVLKELRAAARRPTAARTSDPG